MLDLFHPGSVFVLLLT